MIGSVYSQRDVLIGFGKDPAARLYAEWTEKTCKEM